MSDDGTDQDEAQVHDEEASPSAPSSADSTDADGPVDQLGIPMSREPTLDDVRGDGSQHRRLALGCTLLVALLLVAFYGLRVLAMR